MTEQRSQKERDAKSQVSSKNESQGDAREKPKDDFAEEDCHTTSTHTGFGAGDPTDGRRQYKWESNYPDEANALVIKEARVLLVFFFGALLFIFLTWTGHLAKFVEVCLGVNGKRFELLEYYLYFSFSGLLGGTILSIKFLYHAVARGIWHTDRILWRFITPWMSLGVAFIVAALIHNGVFGEDTASGLMSSGAGAVSIGFISGYFSDNAIAKMYELANVFFGASNNKPAAKK